MGDSLGTLKPNPNPNPNWTVGVDSLGTSKLQNPPPPASEEEEEDYSEAKGSQPQEIPEMAELSSEPETVGAWLLGLLGDVAGHYGLGTVRGLFYF